MEKNKNLRSYLQPLSPCYNAKKTEPGPNQLNVPPAVINPCMRIHAGDTFAIPILSPPMGAWSRSTDVHSEVF